MKKIEKSVEIGGRKLLLSTGHLAQQATSAVLAQYGETVVLATVVAAPLKEDWGYFPLSVEYQERLYAGGRIKGSRWVKREGRPSDDGVLAGRLIDRSIRPLFSEDYKKEVQVTLTVLSVDLENAPDIVAAIAVSAVLATSSIPWAGPIGVVRIGLKDGEFLVNPKVDQRDNSEIDLVVAGTEKAIIMVEAGAEQVPEEVVLNGIAYAQREIGNLIKFINNFAAEVGQKKEPLLKIKADLGLEKKISKLSDKSLTDIITKLARREIGYSEFDEYKFSLISAFGPEEKKTVTNHFNTLFQKKVKKMLLSKKRPDGRKPDEIRKLAAQVGILPRTHGSAIFQRGQTQVLTISTLGAPSLEQLIESAEGEESKRYIHHYSMPPYSTGETGRMGYPSRREIGHGALVERALLPVIPSEEDFPYTIRVVSEVLSSNGSTSMAATCASSLSLMDAGVPIKASVAGIAMGVVMKDKKDYVILTDISGLEDLCGDMDLKVAGTRNGITALQMDVKTLSLSSLVLKDALNAAKEARNKILEVVRETIAEPRPKISTYAPKIKVVKIPQDKIGELIGPGGRMIKSIIAETGAQLEVEDDGKVNISGATDEEVDNALKKVQLLTKEIQPGEIYEGLVKRIEPFGVFVEIAPGRDGLVHISDMSQDFVKSPSDIVRIGDKVSVRVKEIDNLGRINLSMLLGGDRERQTGNRNKSWTRSKNFDKRGQKKDSSGPHFPASRFLKEKRKDFTR